MNASPLRDRMHRLAPGIAAGTSLGVSDVLAKIVLASGVDVVSMLSFRTLVGLAFVATWFRFGRRPTANLKVRLISMVVGIIFTGLIFCLFNAIETIDVPTAILSYFTYPLLTGLTAAFAGIEPLRWKGMLCAVVAFCGLALLIDAHPAGFVVAGVAYAIGAAGCRTAVLLVTRAYLVGADARLTTWYSMLSSTVILLVASFAQTAWNLPHSGLAWSCLVTLSLATTAAILFVFLSTVRIGAFRTAVIMHLEPLTATILSGFVLGQVITPMQALGVMIMLASLHFRYGDNALIQLSGTPHDVRSSRGLVREQRHGREVVRERWALPSGESSRIAPGVLGNRLGGLHWGDLRDAGSRRKSRPFCAGRGRGQISPPLLRHRECHTSVLDGGAHRSHTDVTNHLWQRLPVLSAQSN